jgi:hypothetical protein
MCSLLGRETWIRALIGFWEPLGSIGEATRMILVRLGLKSRETLNNVNAGV